MQDSLSDVTLYKTHTEESWKCGSNHAKSWRSAPSFQDTFYDLLHSGGLLRQPTETDWHHCRPIRLEIHCGGWLRQPTETD
jgi:hypothetical protein